MVISRMIDNLYRLMNWFYILSVTICHIEISGLELEPLRLKFGNGPKTF